MITIEGLTSQQVELCNRLWACDTREEMEKVYFSLPTEERRMATVLIDLMIQESIEEKIKSMDSYPLAEELLKNILSSK